MTKTESKETKEKKEYSFKTFYFFENIWQDIRTYFHNNDTLFDISFMVVYFLIQLGLVCATFMFRTKLDLLPYIVSFFALFLLTTVGIHRLFMESKNRFIKERKDDLIMNYNDLKTQYNLLVSEYNSQNRVLRGVTRDNELLFLKNEELNKELGKKRL